MNTQLTLYTLLLITLNCTCARAQNCIPSAITTLDANGVRATLTTGGDLWWDGSNAGYVVTNEANSPNGKQTNMMFAGGFWMAGRDPGGSIKMAAQKYGRASGWFDYQPGPLSPDGTDFGNCQDWDHFFRVNRQDVDDFLARWEAGTATAADIPASLAGWPATGNPHFAATHGFALPNNPGGMAPFWDENLDGVYNPLDGDYPAFCGETAVWWVFNDNRVHQQSASVNNLQVEVQVMAYAVAADDDVLHRTTFYDYTIINRGSEDLRDAHAGLWVDVDVGCFTNDGLSSDFERGLFYAYNQVENEGETCDGGIVTSDSMRPVNIYQFVGESLAEEPLGNAGRSFTALMDNPLGTPPPDFLPPFTPEEYLNVLSGKTTTGRPMTRRGLGNSVMGGDTTRMAFDGGLTDDGIPWRLCDILPTSGLWFNGVYALGPFDLPAGQAGHFTLAVSSVFGVDYDENCPDTEPVLAAADTIQNYFTNSCSRAFLTDVVSPVAPQEIGLEVFPNPTSEVVHFRLPGNMRIAEVVLYDLTGREAGRIPGSGESLMLNVAAEKLAKGVYLYRLRTAAGEVTAGTIIVR